MLITVLSFALAAGSLSGLWIVGKRPLAGWVFLACMEVLWIAYSVYTKQYGLSFLCIAYGILYSFNTYRAYKAK
jgi:hypothetical protein